MTNLERTKDWALKSGYPFENDVHSTILAALGTDAEIRRNLEFSAKNEDGDPSIRSVDFRCTLSKRSRTIPHLSVPPGPNESILVTLIIDAKFSTDESFLFVPTAENGKHQWPRLIPTYSELGRTLTSQLDFRRDLVRFATVEDIPVASSGRKVKDQSKERDSVGSAALQVIQGLTAFFIDESRLIGQAVDHHYYRNAHYFIPIVVTNAPLLMLNKDVSVDKARNATTKTDILQETELVCLEMPRIYDLKTEWERAGATLRASNKNFGWHESGLGEGVILFSTPSGLSNFLKRLRIQFDALPYELKT